MYNSSVWQRRGESVISAQIFVGIFTSCVFMGFLTTAITAYYMSNLEYRVLILPLLLGGVLGLIVALKNDNAVLSVVGLLLVAGAFGSVLGPIFQKYEPGCVNRVFLLAACVFAAFGVVSTLLPDNLTKEHFWILGGLWLLAGVPIMRAILVTISPVMGEQISFWDFIAVIVVGGYAMYDLYRASNVSYTVDNAVDCAVAIFLDFGVLFYYLLHIMGGNDD